MGKRIEGLIPHRVKLESGPHAVVERSREFTLLPWRDVLEPDIGKAASGILRADGVSWQFRREQSDPAVS